MKRVVKEPDVRRTEIINTAQALFYTKGYETTSVNDIVKAVGVAKGTFYHYFESKTAVLEEIIEMLTEQGMAIMRTVVDDPTLDALEKWRRSFDVLGSWKTAQKEEMVQLMTLMYRDENILMRQKLQTATVGSVSAEMAKIIQQGVDEGVFATTHPQEAAEMVLAMSMVIRESLIPYFLHPEQFDNAFEHVKRKITAIQTAIERILGAPEGTLPFVEDAVLAAWFETKEG